MEMLTLDIPAAFIRTRLGRPTWRELRFGLENQLLDPAAVPDFAADELAQADASPVILELATVDAGEPVRDRVRDLADAEPASDGDAKQTWLFLSLAWLFDHRADLPDPLGTVEVVYAEFGYPQAIEDFVRYMPGEGPDLGDRALNERRLIEKWRRYVDAEQERLSR
jgi:hypothetical protein